METILTLIQEIWSHIAVINDELGDIKIDVAVLKAQVSQVLWLQRAVLLIIIGFVITKILAKVFNNKK